MRPSRLWWIGTSAVVFLALYAGLSAYRFREGPVYWCSETSFSLDLERAGALAKLHNKPVLVYFSGVNCTNGRRMERGVLGKAAVIAHLHQFVCVAAFVDRVPIVEAGEASRLLSQNQRLSDSIFEDAELPSFVVFSSEFDPADEEATRKVLGAHLGFTDDEKVFLQFLDKAPETGTESRYSTE